MVGMGLFLLILVAMGSHHAIAEEEVAGAEVPSACAREVAGASDVAEEAPVNHWEAQLLAHIFSAESQGLPASTGWIWQRTHQPQFNELLRASGTLLERNWIKSTAGASPYVVADGEPVSTLWLRMVEHVRKPDNASTYVHLTDEGKAAVERLMAEGRIAVSND